MEHVLQRLREAGELAHRAGPYVLLELLLPGGTLVALALYVYRRSEARRLAGRAEGRVDRLLGRMAARLEDALDLRVVASRSRGNDDDGLGPLGMTAG